MRWKNINKTHIHTLAQCVVLISLALLWKWQTYIGWTQNIHAAFVQLTANFYSPITGGLIQQNTEDELLVTTKELRILKTSQNSILRCPQLTWHVEIQHVCLTDLPSQMHFKSGLQTWRLLVLSRHAFYHDKKNANHMKMPC